MTYSENEWSRCDSIYSDNGISSPRSAASDGSDMKVDCVSVVKRTLSSLQLFMPESASPRALCAALAIAIQKEYGWIVRWACLPVSKKSKGPWNNPLSHECQFTAPPQWSQCVLMISPTDKVECVVDTCFRSKFDIGGKVYMYEQLLDRVPKIFVGTAPELRNKVEELSNAVSTCFQYLGRELPPWRTKENLSMLYKVCLENDGAVGDALLRELEAGLDGCACGTREFAEDEVAGLWGYLQDNGLDAWTHSSSDLFWDEDTFGIEPEEPYLECSASNLTLLLRRVPVAAPEERPPCRPAVPAVVSPEAWSALAPGPMRRVKRLDDLNAHCQSPLP